MDGIGHYEAILAEVYEKIRDRVPLSMDDKIDYYLAVNRISFRKSEIEISQELKGKYRREAEVALETAQRLEKRIGIKRLKLVY